MLHIGGKFIKLHRKLYFHLFTFYSDCFIYCICFKLELMSFSILELLHSSITLSRERERDRDRMMTAVSPSCGEVENQCTCRCRCWELSSLWRRKISGLLLGSWNSQPSSGWTPEVDYFPIKCSIPLILQWFGNDT